MNDALTIQQVADRTGLSAHTLRYYERIGLLAPIQRAENGHRRYSADDLGWIDFLKKLRATGMPIAQMARYAALQRDGDATLQARVAILKEHREVVRARMQELQTHLEVIDYKIDFYAKEQEKQTTWKEN